MALNTGQPFCNTTDGFLCEGKDIKGGYFVVDTITNAPSAIAVLGSLCYVSDENMFYRYSEKTEDGEVIGYWAPHNMPHILIRDYIPVNADPEKGIEETPGNIGDIIVVINN
jgi:hypothetical protein